MEGFDRLGSKAPPDTRTVPLHRHGQEPVLLMYIRKYVMACATLIMQSLPKDSSYSGRQVLRRVRPDDFQPRCGCLPCGPA